MSSSKSFFRLAVSLALLASTPVAAHADDGQLADLLGGEYGNAALNELAGTEETLNRVTLMHLGRNSEPMRLKLLDEAERYVFMTVPYWFDDAEGNKFFNAMQSKIGSMRQAGRKFEFKVMLDWTSPASSGDFWGTKMFKRLNDLSGGNALLWNKLWDLRPWSAAIYKNRIHDKIYVIDGKKLIMGGMNVADEYLEGGLTAKGWHDTDILVEGPAAQQATKIFLRPFLLQQYLNNRKNPFPSDEQFQIKVLNDIFQRDLSVSWFRNEGFSKLWQLRKEVRLPYASYLASPEYFPALEPAPADAIPMRLVYDNPLVDRKPVSGKHFSRALQTLQYILPMAKESVRMFVPYLTTTDEMNDTLIAAAKRGLKVQIITNSLKSHDLGDIDYKAALVNFVTLMRQGIEIYEWQGHEDLISFYGAHGCKDPTYWPGRTLHTKVVMIDGSVTLLGSNNLNVRSEKFNSEIMALIRDHGFTQQMNSVFDYDLDTDDSVEAMSVSCGGRSLSGRPKRVIQQNLENLKAIFKKEGLWIKFLHLFQPVM